MNPRKDALGRASLMCRAYPSMKSYWLPGGLIGDDHDVAAFGEDRVGVSPSPQERIFWMVVNTTPPDVHGKIVPEVGSALCLGRSCLRRSLHLENVPKSWSSRSFRSVRTTIVGLFIAGSRMTAPA